MDLLPIANLFISSISALSSMVQAYNSSKTKQLNTDKEEKRLDTPLKIGGKTVSQVIDSKLLNTLTKKAEKEARELISLINKTQDPELLEIAMNEANNRLCFYLNQIKIYNNDKLPTKRLNQLWLSHKCQRED